MQKMVSNNQKAVWRDLEIVQGWRKLARSLNHRSQQLHRVILFLSTLFQAWSGSGPMQVLVIPYQAI